MAKPYFSQSFRQNKAKGLKQINTHFYFTIIKVLIVLASKILRHSKAKGLKILILSRNNRFTYKLFEKKSFKHQVKITYDIPLLYSRVIYMFMKFDFKRFFR